LLLCLSCRFPFVVNGLLNCSNFFKVGLRKWILCSSLVAHLPSLFIRWLNSTPHQLTSLASEFASGFFPARIRQIVEADTFDSLATPDQSRPDALRLMSRAITSASLLKLTVCITRPFAINSVIAHYCTSAIKSISILHGLKQKTAPLRCGRNYLGFTDLSASP
jgi:hypothetical protein